MNPPDFRIKIATCHKSWLGDLFKIDDKDYFGIDLLSEDLGIEIKSRLIGHGGPWSVHTSQIDNYPKLNPKKKLFFAFVLYNLNLSIYDLNEEDNLESHITERTIWFRNWNWILNKPRSYVKTGPYVYISKKLFSQESTDKCLNTRNATLYFPRNSHLEDKLVSKH